MIEHIQAKVVFGELEYSQHAIDQTLLRFITVQDYREAIANGQIIENFPNDKYGPSCLVLGFTSRDRRAVDTVPRNLC